MKKQLLWWFFPLSLMMVLLKPVSACTDFRLTAEDGTLLISRSMEFGIPLNSSLRSSPKGRNFVTTTPNEKPGMTWKSRYGYLYLDGFGVDAAFDGMNEAGLTFEYLYLPGITQYQQIPPGQDAKALPYYNLGDWVLGNFKTVDEVRDALQDIYVTDKLLPQLGKAIVPAHASIYDASGKGIVVEFYKDRIWIYDSVGVMTNSPKYEWQVTNLQNYVNLTPNNPPVITQGGMSYTGNGMGSGAVGLPGDASPPSRFVKVAFMTANVFKAKTAEELLNLAQHIMNNVDLPAGYVRSEFNGKTETDTTQWVVFKDITHRKIYFKTYNDLNLHMVDMNKVDLSADAKPLVMPLPEGTTSPADETVRFMGGKALN